MTDCKKIIAFGGNNKKSIKLDEKVAEKPLHGRALGIFFTELVFHHHQSIVDLYHFWLNSFAV